MKIQPIFESVRRSSWMASIGCRPGMAVSGGRKLMQWQTNDDRLLYYPFVQWACLKFTILLLIGLVLLAGSVWASPVPGLRGRVNDYAQVLSPEIRQKLDDQLRAQEEATSNQLVVLTIASLEGGTIEEYAHEVFRTWQLGKAGKNNGILLLVAVNDRQTRIEVGYGLEGALPDVICKRIMRHEMTPRFRDGDFNAGINEGVVAIMAATQGTYKPEDSDTSYEQSASPSPSDELSLSEKLMMGIPLMVTLVVLTWAMIVFMQQSWFVFAFLLLFYLVFPPFLFGLTIGGSIVATYVAVFLGSRWYYRRPSVLARQPSSRSTYRSSRSTALSSAWTATSDNSASWSSDSSSSSDSSYSGGGGDSGGGGSSDSW